MRSCGEPRRGRSARSSRRAQWKRCRRRRDSPSGTRPIRRARRRSRRWCVRPRCRTSRSLAAALKDKDWAVRVQGGRAASRARPGSRRSTRRSGPRRALRLARLRGSARRAPRQYSTHFYIDTDKGTIQIELEVLDAPLDGAHVHAIWRGAGYFGSVAIHRVVPNFVVQDGDPRGDGEGGPGYHDSRRAQRAALPARHRRHGARLGGYRRQPVLHHALAAAASRRALHRRSARSSRGWTWSTSWPQGDVIRGVRVWDGRHRPTRCRAGQSEQ